MAQPVPAGPEVAAEQAETLFSEAFGEAPDRVAAASPYLPLLAEHTRYFGGFGLLLRLPWGVAVAVRPAERPRLSALGLELPRRGRLAALLYDATGSHWDLALVATGATPDPEAVLAAALTAVLDAVGIPASDRVRLVTEGVEAATQRPAGPAYALACADGGGIVLVDATTLEHLELDAPETVGFGLLCAPPPEPLAPHADWERRDLVEDALAHLRARGFASLSALRRLEHRDLGAALQALPTSLVPFVRYLVTEDRRVPRLVAALKRDDGQKLGALLLMSLASRRDDEGYALPLAETVAEEVVVTDGVYGVRPAGRAGAVLVVGRRLLLPDFLDAQAAAETRTLLL